MHKFPFCFVSRDDWDEWKRINSDISPSITWEFFRDKCGEFSKQIVTNGGRAIQINVRPGDFVAWCVAGGHKVNAQARAQYAAVRLVEIMDQGN